MDLSVNPNTVSRAYNELELTGLVETHMGSGTFIGDKRVERDEVEHRRILAMHLFELGVVVDVLAVALSLAFLVRLLQIWDTALLFTTVGALYLFLRHRPHSEVLVVTVIVAGFLSPALQMAYQWERAVILRFLGAGAPGTTGLVLALLAGAGGLAVGYAAGRD